MTNRPPGIPEWTLRKIVHTHDSQEANIRNHWGGMSACCTGVRITQEGVNGGAHNQLSLSKYCMDGNVRVLVNSSQLILAWRVDPVTRWPDSLLQEAQWKSLRHVHQTLAVSPSAYKVYYEHTILYVVSLVGCLIKMMQHCFKSENAAVGE